MEVAQVFISRSVDKIAIVYLQNRILLSHKKKKKILPFETTWMDLESIMLSEISQSERGKYPMISLTCGI